MSRLTVTIFVMVLLSQTLIHGTLAQASEGLESGDAKTTIGRRQKQLQRQQQQNDIDLTELTPNLERQLQQAKRLNRGESVGDRMLVGEAAAAGELLAGATQRGNWFDRIHSVSNLRRRSGPQRYSRGLSHYYHAPEDVAKYSAMPTMYDDRKEDKAHELMGGPSSNSIDNHESVSRASLWTSDLLRDLLIAQEAANRLVVGKRLLALLGGRRVVPDNGHINFK